MIKILSGVLYSLKDPRYLSHKQGNKNRWDVGINVKMYTLYRNYIEYLLLHYTVRILINQSVNCSNRTGNERNCNVLLFSCHQLMVIN